MAQPDHWSQTSIAKLPFIYVQERTYITRPMCAWFAMAMPNLRHLELDQVLFDPAALQGLQLFSTLDTLSLRNVHMNVPRSLPTNEYYVGANKRLALVGLTNKNMTRLTLEGFRVSVL